jgi:hypothetical protein
MSAGDSNRSGQKGLPPKKSSAEGGTPKQFHVAMRMREAARLMSNEA